MSSVVSNDAPTSSQNTPAAPATVVSADRTAAEPSRPSDDAETSSHEGEGEQAEARPQKTAEQRERDTLARARTRLERVNARLWQENQELRRNTPQQRQPSQGQGAQQDDAEERVQVSRKDFETAADQRARQLAARMTSEEKLAERCNTLLDNGVKKDPQFDRAIVTVGHELPLFGQDGSPTSVFEEILDSPKAIDIILHLRDNPDIAAELADLSPAKQGRRLEAIERELATPTRQVQTPPRPLEPEHPAASSAEPDVTKNPTAWREWRNRTSKVT